MKCEGPRQWPSDKDHMLTPTTVSRVTWSVRFEWATPGSKDSNWFSLTLDLGSVMSCIRQRVWRQVTCFQILTPPFLAVSSQSNHLNSLSPSFFFLHTYISIHPSIHLLPSSITAGCAKEEKRKYKEGSIKRVSGIWGKSEGGSVSQETMTAWIFHEVVPGPSQHDCC